MDQKRYASSPRLTDFESYVARHSRRDKSQSLPVLAQSRVIRPVGHTGVAVPWQHNVHLNSDLWAHDDTGGKA